MNQPSLARLLEADNRPRRPGRPVADSFQVRRKHVRVAYFCLRCGMTRREAARAFRITEPTVREWIRRALSYDDPLSEGLRRTVAPDPEPEER